jgi:hypothetical protein
VPPSSSTRTVSGIGDIYAGVTWSTEPARDFYLDLTGKVKIPVASQVKGLGSGKADVTFAIDATKVIGTVSLYGGTRYRIIGKSPAFTSRNTWGASIGASVDASRALNLAVDYDWQQSSFAGGKPSSEVTASATIKLAPSLRLQAYGTTGLNSQSVDAAGGLQLIWKFARF